MLASIALISVMAALAFLAATYYFRHEIVQKMQPPQRVPVVIRVDDLDNIRRSK